MAEVFDEKHVLGSRCLDARIYRRELYPTTPNACTGASLFPAATNIPNISSHIKGIRSIK